MKKYVKLSGPVYLNCDHLEIRTDYSKRLGGYTVSVTPVGLKEGIVSLTLGQEYFAVQKYIETLIIPAGRRSAKKEEEADGLLAANWEEYAKEFLSNIGRNDLAIENE